MNKRGMFVNILLIVVLLFLGGIFSWSSYNREQICLDKSLEKACNPECAESCEKLDMNYFKYEYHGGLFWTSESNCFCVKNKTVTQVY